MSKGVNSSAPTTAEILGGVYNATPITLQDGQAAALQLTVDGKLVTSASSGGTTNVNIADVAGNPPALSNPLPVELSDGTNAVGTLVNPIRVDPTGSTTQPISATSLPLPTGASTSANQTNGNQKSQTVDGSGNVQPAGDTPARSINVEVTDGTNVLGTSGHPVRTDPTGTTTQPVSGQVAASAETGTVYNGSTALTPLFATISASSSGAQSLISAVSSKKIRVLALSLVANGAVNAKFQSHTTPTDLTGLYYLAQNGGIVLPFNPAGWFQTNTGEQLDINLSGAVAVGGSITYVTV